MDPNQDKRILQLLIIATGLITIMLIALAIAFGVAFKSVRNSIQTTNRDSDIVSAIRSLKVVSGQNGADGVSIVGPAGKDSTSTTTVIQQPTNGTNGASAYDIWLQLGNSGTPQNFIDSLKPTIGCPDWQTDNMGNYRCHPSDDWLPLNEVTP